MWLRVVCTLWVLPTLIACRESPTTTVTASLVMHGGHLVTMAGGSGVAQAVAIDGDRIVAVGSSSDMLALATAASTVIDLGGRTVLPGIVDAHSHLFNDAHRLGLDLDAGQALALENGITTLANMFVPPDFLDEMVDFAATGRLRLRTSLYLTHTDNCGFPAWGTWWQAHPPTRAFGERLRIGGIKIFADGGTCGPPAVSVEFEAGSGHGELFLDAGQVAEVVALAEQSGHQVVIHAIGDRAIQAAQDGIELALDGRTNVLRHRIDHNALVTDALIARYEEIGIQPVVFGYFPPGVLDRQTATCPPAARNAFYAAFEGNTRSLLDALPQMRVAWHGDDPWIGPVSPMRELYNMVTRIRRSSTFGECPPPDWQLATRIGADEGLRMMTVNSAWALHRDAEVGSLEPGKLADLIVLSASPLEVPSADLWDIEVGVTMIGGEVVFCRSGYEVLCPDP